MNNHERLRHYIESEFQSLLRSVELYVMRAGLARGEEVFPMAMDVFNEAVMDALKKADQFDASRQPRAWLLGISTIVIKRRRSERAKRIQREPLIYDLYGHNTSEMNEDEIFDRVARLAENPASQHLETDEAVKELLAGVSESDQEILRLAIIHGMNGEALAHALGISAGAARVRLHRALDRLRQVHGAQIR